MKPILIIALFTISISLIEWGLLQVALDEQLSKKSMIFAVLLSPSHSLQHGSNLQLQPAKKAFANRQVVLISRNRKTDATRRFDGRTSW